MLQLPLVDHTPATLSLKTWVTITTHTVLTQCAEVSKHHAKILWERVYWENTFWLMDEGSVNGTFLNDKRISESKVPLQEKKVSSCYYQLLLIPYIYSTE